MAEETKPTAVHQLHRRHCRELVAAGKSMDAVEFLLDKSKAIETRTDAQRFVYTIQSGL